MGIRAHLIEEIRYGGTRSFLEDDAINEWLIQNGKLDPLNVNCHGISEFSLSDLRQMAAITSDPELRQEIEIDIAWAESENRTYIDYDFY